jgi:CO dehydrogenase maturation factor
MAKSIAVAGKGGTGKSTIAALVILALREKKQLPILAIDADPDSNLGTMLGVTVEQTIGDLREDVLEEIKNFPPGMSKPQYVEAGLHRIIEESSGFDLITMGKGEGAGCYCYLNSLIRKFSEDLFDAYRWIVIDNEAGLEHISRRTATNIDALLVVVSDNPISLNTARSIDKISKTLKNAIGKKYIVTNMLESSKRDRVMERVNEIGMEFAGDVPYDPALEDLVFQGKPLTELGDGPARQSIRSLLEKIGGAHGVT